jgi:hypothetical protein
MLFADNIQQHTYRMYMYTTLRQAHPLLPLTPSLFTLVNPTLYLLGEPAFLARGANTHPLLSPVCYQLFPPLLFHPPQGTPWIKLHIYLDDINNISRLVWYSIAPLTIHRTSSLYTGPPHSTQRTLTVHRTHGPLMFKFLLANFFYVHHIFSVKIYDNLYKVQDISRKSRIFCTWPHSNHIYYTFFIFYIKGPQLH